MDFIIRTTDAKVIKQISDMKKSNTEANVIQDAELDTIHEAMLALNKLGIKQSESCFAITSEAVNFCLLNPNFASTSQLYAYLSKKFKVPRYSCQQAFQAARDLIHKQHNLPSMFVKFFKKENTSDLIGFIKVLTKYVKLIRPLKDSSAKVVSKKQLMKFKNNLLCVFKELNLPSVKYSRALYDVVLYALCNQHLIDIPFEVRQNVASQKKVTTSTLDGNLRCAIKAAWIKPEKTKLQHELFGDEKAPDINHFIVSVAKYVIQMSGE